MTTFLPTNVGFGFITGTIIFAVADTNRDSDQDPDAVAVAGTVTFTATPSIFRNTAEKLIMLPRPFVVDLDSNGQFLIKLLATDDTDFATVNWSYVVSFQVGVEISPFTIVVPEGQTHDLSEYAMEESLPGVVTFIGPVGPSTYQLAVSNGYLGTLSQWLDSIEGTPGLPGATGNPAEQGGFSAPTVANEIATVNIKSNWGINSGVGYYTAAGAVTAEAAIAHLLSDGYPGLRRIGDADTTIAEEHGSWVSAITYRHGEIVTHAGARWFCKVANTSSAPTRTNLKWVHLGLWAMISTTDPGGGMGWLSPSSGGQPTPVDTTPPTVPTGLAATSVSFEQINLTWNASTDAVGVAFYNVRRGGVLVATISAPATTYQDLGLSANTVYSYTVAAADAAGNQSAFSVPASATTQAGGGGDTTPPTAPTDLAATVISSNQINLTWTASTDAVGVVSYRVRRSGVVIATVASPTTSYQSMGLTASTTYSYTVSAVDAAGNQSALSTLVSATTQSGPSEPGTGLDGGTFAVPGSGADGGSFSSAGSDNFDGGGF